MVEIIEKGISLDIKKIDNFLLRFKSFLIDALRDSKDQSQIDMEKRILLLDYHIVS